MGGFEDPGFVSRSMQVGVGTVSEREQIVNE